MGHVEFLWIRVMADYAAWPLWHDADEEGHFAHMGDIDPRALGLSAGLVDRLNSWQEEWDAGIDWTDPGASAGVLDEDAFDHEGRQLAQAVAVELGSRARVRYWKDAAVPPPGDG